MSQDVDIIYERFVLILQQAQNIAKEVENNKVSYSINKNFRGKNLFKVLKKIEIVDTYNAVKEYIEKLSIVREFLKDLEAEDDIDATEKLLSIPGFESAFKRANQQIKEGKVRDWREIQEDIVLGDR